MVVAYGIDGGEQVDFDRCNCPYLVGSAQACYCITAHTVSGDDNECVRVEFAYFLEEEGGVALKLVVFIGNCLACYALYEVVVTGCKSSTPQWAPR